MKRLPYFYYISKNKRRQGEAYEKRAVWDFTSDVGCGERESSTYVMKLWNET